MDKKNEKKKVKNYEFQSEVKQLLDILVYSLYKHKEVFLRELISNAIDALNKFQFATLTDKTPEKNLPEMKITIRLDKKLKTLTVEDTGIGMTKEDLVQNLGTIAHSGTIDFINRISNLKNKKDMDLIGKFGVGFYSSFMVADEISVYTRAYKKGSKGYLWKSKGDNSYSIEETDKKEMGTKIVLHLKKDETEFLEKFKIKNIIEKHSKFLPFPIYIEDEKVESTSAIWTQPASVLKKKDYIDFFKFSENSSEEPEAYIHLSSDAPVQFNSILFIPKSNFELFGLLKKESGIDLYSSRVLISKGSKDIIPEYLRFITGIVDSLEIPLNISRESIQSNIKIDKIRKFIVKKIIRKLKDLKTKSPDKYKNIWKNFNKNIKEGIINDFDNRNNLAELLLFNSSNKGNELTDLDSYMENMGKNQGEIYFATGTDLNSIENNPALEIFKEKNIEVIYLLDPIDEFVFDHLKEYKDKKFKIAESSDLNIKKSDKKEEDKTYIKEVENFVLYLKTLFGEKLTEVKISKRLIKSPSILVNDPSGPSAQMEKVMKIMNKEYSFSKRILEINPENSLIKELVRIHKVNPGSEQLKYLSTQLLDNLLMREGLLENLDNAIPRIQDIMLFAAKNVK